MSIHTRCGLPEPSRAEKVRIMKGTMCNIARAIRTHGPLVALLESLMNERMILDGFIHGTCDENGFPTGE